MNNREFIVSIATSDVVKIIVAYVLLKRLIKSFKKDINADIGTKQKTSLSLGK